MSKFVNTKRLPKTLIDSLPISEGQTYFDIDNLVLYKDMNNQRFALGEFFSVEQFNLLNQESIKNLKNVLLIDQFATYDTDPEYRLWYVDPEGEAIDLGFGNNSAGIYNEPEIQMNLDNTFTVTACCVNLYLNKLMQGPIKRFALSPTTINMSTLNEDTPYYIVAQYDIDAQVVSIELLNSVETINESNVVPIFSVYRSGSTLHRLTWDSMGAGLVNKLHQRIVKTDRFKRESGLTPSNPFERYITVDQGIVYYGAAKDTLSKFNSYTPENHKLIYLYHDINSNWVKDDSSSQVDNQHYDPITGRAILNNNYYAVAWIYRGTTKKIPEGDPDVYYILSNEQYNQIDQARNSPEPILPSFIQPFSILVAKGIIQKGIANFIEFYSMLDASSGGGGGSSITVHNNLTGRDAADTHPIGSITGLQSELDSKIQKETTNWIIENTQDDFKIIQKGTPNKNMITVYELPSGTSPTRKIEIGSDDNDTTLIHNLDFGGW